MGIIIPNNISVELSKVQYNENSLSYNWGCLLTAMRRVSDRYHSLVLGLYVDIPTNI